MFRVRDTELPAVYRGHRFRSGLEATVASQLDDLGGVTWYYEMPVQKALTFSRNPWAIIPPVCTYYLPDFTIASSRKRFALPLFIEVKPPDFLYAVRDHFKVDERFSQDTTFPCTADVLGSIVPELKKPKKCAEDYGESILVVSAMNRTRTLSLLLSAEAITLSRRHPGVNHKEMRNRARRVAQSAQWHVRYTQAIEAHRESARQRQEDERQRHAYFLDNARRLGRPAKYDGICSICSCTTPSRLLTMYLDTHYGRWIALCTHHLAKE